MFFLAVLADYPEFKPTGNYMLETPFFNMERFKKDAFFVDRFTWTHCTRSVFQICPSIRSSTKWRKKLWDLLQFLELVLFWRSFLVWLLQLKGGLWLLRDAQSANVSACFNTERYTVAAGGETLTPVGRPQVKHHLKWDIAASEAAVKLSTSQANLCV